jgi:cell division protein FtsN
MESSKKPPKSTFKPFVAGLALGALAGMVGMHLYQPGGRTTVMSQPPASTPANCPPPAQNQVAAAATKQAKDFNFYGVLEKADVPPVRPDLEQPAMPPPLQGPSAEVAAGAPTKAPAAEAGKPFYLQVASFKAAADADALKARIVLMGEPAIVVAMDIPEQGTHYRVRVGPFTDKAELAHAKAQLQEGKINLEQAFVVR